jgi:lipopolysaccharide export system permease protein
LTGGPRKIEGVKILDRYVSQQVLITGLMAIGVLSVVLVLGNVFKQLLELLVNHDAPLELILSFIAYILPFSLTFTIPWGFLTAVLLVFGKMSAENELIALRSSGVSIPRVCVVVLVAALACVGTCLYINLIVAPQAQVKMKDALYNIATNNPLAMFGSDKVIDQFPGYKIYVEKSHGAELENLLVYKQGEEKSRFANVPFAPMQVIHAQRGSLETEAKEKRILLHIYQGRFEQRDDQDPNDLMKLKDGIIMEESTLPISLVELYEKNKKRRGLSTRTVGELLEHLDSLDPDPKKQLQMKTAAVTEVSKRFSFSLASLAFGLIGVPLAITAQRRETSIGFLLSLIIAFVYFLFIIIADSFKNAPKAHPELLVWIPNFLFIGLGCYMFYKLSRK